MSDEFNELALKVGFVNAKKQIKAERREKKIKLLEETRKEHGGECYCRICRKGRKMERIFELQVRRNHIKIEKQIAEQENLENIEKEEERRREINLSRKNPGYAMINSRLYKEWSHERIEAREEEENMKQKIKTKN